MEASAIRKIRPVVGAYTGGSIGGRSRSHHIKMSEQMAVHPPCGGQIAVLTDIGIYRCQDQHPSHVHNPQRVQKSG